MGKHYSDLSFVPLERIEADLSRWEDELENARTERGKQNASEIVAELLAEIESRKVAS